MLCNPNKWFAYKDINNAKVNELLYNLDEFAWTTGRNKFDDIKNGDLGIIKVGNDSRSQNCRTINNVVMPKLEAGIYAIIEFISKDGSVLHQDINGINRVHFKVINNLFKNNNIINKNDTKKLLKNNFNSFSSKKISEDIFYNIENFLKYK